MKRTNAFDFMGTIVTERNRSHWGEGKFGGISLHSDSIQGLGWSALEQKWSMLYVTVPRTGRQKLAPGRLLIKL